MAQTVAHLVSSWRLPWRLRDCTLASWPNQHDTEHGGAKAYSKARRFIDEWDLNKWLLLTGDFGVGKTGLAVAVARALCAAYVDEADFWESRFIVAVDLLDALKEGFKDHTDGRLMEDFKSAPLLILDDLGAEMPTEWVRTRFFSLLNNRFDDGLPTIITTNLSMEDLKLHAGERTFWRIVEACGKRGMIDVHGLNMHDPDASEALAQAARTARGERRLRAVPR